MGKRVRSWIRDEIGSRRWHWWLSLKSNFEFKEADCDRGHQAPVTDTSAACT
jgi:hypothetical protein